MVFIGTSRGVHCEDLGPVYPGRRRRGVCSVDGVSLNEWFVWEGWALNFEPYAKGRFKALEADADVSSEDAQ